MAQSAPAAGAGAARALLLLQVLLRLVTFCLNQWLVRTTTPAVFGAAHGQLELVLSVVLSLAREGVRAAMMRRQAELQARGATPATHNLALVPVWAGGVVALVAGVVYVQLLAPPALWAQGGDVVPWSVALYCVGAVWELAAEPLLTHALGVPSYVRIRVAMEAAGVLSKALVNLALLQPAGLAALARLAAHAGLTPTPFACALLAFGLARVAYGVGVWTIGFVGVARARGARRTLALLWPAAGGALRGDPAWALVRVTTAQSVLKLALTESDKLAMARLTSLEDQGGYALASNYGSLVARTLFQPLEESARLRFAPCAQQQGRAAAAAFLHALLHLHVLLACGIVAFGPPLAPTAIALLAGPRWAASAHVAPILASYCWYLPVMGINGTLEAFVQAAAPPATLAWYSNVMLSASVVFAAALAAAPRVGVRPEAAVIVASIAAASVRAAASYAYVRTYFRGTPWAKDVHLWGLAPHGLVAAAWLALGLVLRGAVDVPLAQRLARALGVGLVALAVLYVCRLTQTLCRGAAHPARGAAAALTRAPPSLFPPRRAWGAAATAAAAGRPAQVCRGTSYRTSCAGARRDASTRGGTTPRVSCGGV